MNLYIYIVCIYKRVHWCIYIYIYVGIHGGCDELCRKTIGSSVYTSGTMAQISAAFRRTDPSSFRHAASLRAPTSDSAKTTKNNYPPLTTDEKSLSRAFVFILSPSRLPCCSFTRSLTCGSANGRAADILSILQKNR